MFAGLLFCWREQLPWWPEHLHLLPSNCSREPRPRLMHPGREGRGFSSTQQWDLLKSHELIGGVKMLPAGCFPLWLQSSSGDGPASNILTRVIHQWRQNEHFQYNSLFVSVHLQLYHHGEPINVNVQVTNNSVKTVKRVKISGSSTFPWFFTWLCHYALVSRNSQETQTQKAMCQKDTSLFAASFVHVLCPGYVLYLCIISLIAGFFFPVAFFFFCVCLCIFGFACLSVFCSFCPWPYYSSWYTLKYVK